MRQLLAAVARFLRDDIGWHRIGIALSLCIIAAASVTLVHILRDVDIDRVLAVIEATPARRIAIAAALVAAAYVTLTFYDLFALRTIGHAAVPYRVAAFAAFASYSIGHNIGATVFTGGAIRFRIYSTWGLSVVDVAKMAFVTGLTFWLGNAFVLGLGVAFDPQAATAIDRLPPALNRILAFVLLLAIVGYLAWLAGAPRAIGRAQWRVALPNARLTLVQILIGLLDLGSSGLAMFVLLPETAGVNFVTVLVTFVLSTLLGFASHAPGGLGVFDASMLVALWQFDKEALVAALLLFRLLYYVVPFSLALAVLGGREIRTNLAAAFAARRQTPPDTPCSRRTGPCGRVVKSSRHKD